MPQQNIILSLKTPSLTPRTSHMDDLDPAAKQALIHLMQQATVEIFPSGSVGDQLKGLPTGSRIAVTCSPKRGIEATVQLCAQLQTFGLRVVPHISARLVADNAHLERLLHSLQSHNLREIFVVGGDIAKPAGPFGSSLALLAAIADLGYPFEQVGVTAYPEGHPLIDDQTLLRALIDKQRFATYMVTQICFDPDRIISWLDDVRRKGITLPVDIGIPGAVDRKSLLQFALRIGVGESVSFLARHTDLAGHLIGQNYSPQRLVACIAACAADASYNIRGLHLYTFNRVAETQKWRQELLDVLAAA